MIGPADGPLAIARSLAITGREKVSDTLFRRHALDVTSNCNGVERDHASVSLWIGNRQTRKPSCFVSGKE